MVGVGDQVLLVTGVSEFRVLEIDGDHATVESTHPTAPGRYPFTVRLAELVPVDPT
ncbi:hypothetical protein ACIBJI_41920 [Nocardia sp. NPDC050408]|uniref:hypothetical protein n=1 Tax=Nocardia sp. NPDC050408 TaxID=3364319 RepID=UPI0037BCF8CC